MSGSNYPPGVTGSEPEIQGDGAWEDVHELIDTTCTAKGWTDCDAFLAWSLGVAALEVSRKFGAVFPSDTDEPQVAPPSDDDLMRRALFWDFVNNYAVACGGNPGMHVQGNTARQRLVAEIEAIAFPTNTPQKRHVHSSPPLPPPANPQPQGDIRG